jgi:hypothetical protein
MFTIKVVPDNGEPFEVESQTRDILKWEKTTKGASAHQLREASFEALYKIAWIVAQRTGQFPGTLREFEETVDLDILGGEDEPDPTQSAAPSET